MYIWKETHVRVKRECMEAATAIKYTWKKILERDYIEENTWKRIYKREYLKENTWKRMHASEVMTDERHEKRIENTWKTDITNCR